MAKKSEPRTRASQTRRATKPTTSDRPKHTKSVVSRKPGAPSVDTEPDSDAPSNAERIWQVVAAIPKGKVATYGQVADLAGLPRGARLVGRTMSNLPKGSKLPWFRVLNSRGELSFPRNTTSWRRQRDKLADDGVPLLKGKLSLKIYRWEP